jgi:hypothetical protein
VDRARAGRSPRRSACPSPGNYLVVGLLYAFFDPAPNTDRPDPVMEIRAVWSHDHGASWNDPTAVVPPQSLADDQIAHPRYVGNHTFVMPLGWTDDSYGADYLSLALEKDGRLDAAFAKSRDVSGAKAGLVELNAASIG